MAMAVMGIVYWGCVWISTLQCNLHEL